MYDLIQYNINNLSLSGSICLYKINKWYYKQHVLKSIGCHHFDVKEITDIFSSLKQNGKKITILTNILDNIQTIPHENQLDISILNKIIEIDPLNKIAVVEPSYSFFRINIIYNERI